MYSAQHLFAWSNWKIPFSSSPHDVSPHATQLISQQTPLRSLQFIPEGDIVGVPIDTFPLDDAGVLDGVANGAPDCDMDGVADCDMDGVVDGVVDGNTDGATDGIADGDGVYPGITQGGS